MTQAQLAEACGISQVAVSKWEMGKDEPGADKYAILANLAEGLPERQHFVARMVARSPQLERAMAAPAAAAVSRPLHLTVLPARGAMRSDAPTKPKVKPDVVAVPLLHDSAAAGSPRLIDDSNVDELLFARARRVPHPEHTVAIRVSGDSMSPTLEDGYIVAVDTFETDPAALRNQMVAARDPDGGVTIKWLRHVGEEFVLMAQHTSPRYQPVFLKRERGWKIVGKVLWFIGEPPPG